MLESGELCLGVRCVPYTQERYTTADGQLEKREETIYGRKIPLLQLRQELLAQHEPYMRLTSDDDVDNVT